ncbi:hypothetical protein PGB90_004028 [Kerria lacca]
MSQWPEDVGIKAIEFVFPKQYVDQTELEKYDGIDAGKYTIGLGQKQMGFCSELEDINSLCLTAFNRLVDRFSLKYEDIGRVDVGTETIVDKSKSVKSVLMSLFEKSGNFNVEGLDTTNACYGGTAALFNAVSWVESSLWDGRLAVVVAGDIAVYAKGNARPTGGAGAVAMLIGSNAPLVFERHLRGTYMSHVYDFYKPDLTSEYPVVDGPLSIKCYFKALDNCYRVYREHTRDPDFTLNKFDAFCFHSPFCKLVQKSFARLILNDFIRCGQKNLYYPGLEDFRNVTLDLVFSDKKEDKIQSKKTEDKFLEYSKNTFKIKTEPSLELASRIGNMYTASVYSCLISYLSSKSAKELAGKRIGLFSYGSGLASTMYSIRVKDCAELGKLVENCRCIRERLDTRKKLAPEEFEAVMDQREKSLHRVPFHSGRSTSELFPEIVKIEYPGEYEKELWQIDDKNKLELIPKLKEEGNVFYEKQKYEKALEKYELAFSFIDQLQLREKPRDVEWNDLNRMKVPYLLNIAQCKLCLKDYYSVIENCNSVLEIEKNNVKALFRRGKAHIKVWNLQQAKEDLEKVLLLDKNEKSSVMSLMAEIKKAEIESKNSDKALMKKKIF